MKRFGVILVLCLVVNPLYACKSANSGEQDIVNFSELSGYTSHEEINNENIANQDESGNNESTSNISQGEDLQTESSQIETSANDTSQENAAQEDLSLSEDLSSQEDLYSGEYNDYDNNEPNLMIQKSNDGSYWIQIGIYRLVQLDDCIGYEKDGKIEFKVNNWDWGLGDINGTITIENNIATVKFTTGWNSSIDEYKYYK